jgi:hypothetical protein
VGELIGDENKKDDSDGESDELQSETFAITGFVDFGDDVGCGDVDESAGSDGGKDGHGGL